MKYRKKITTFDLSDLFFKKEEVFGVLLIALRTLVRGDTNLEVGSLYICRPKLFILPL